MSENKCCATCDRAAQLYVGDTPTVYRFCQLSGSIPHLSHEYCEDYIPLEARNADNNYSQFIKDIEQEPISEMREIKEGGLWFT